MWQFLKLDADEGRKMNFENIALLPSLWIKIESENPELSEIA
jgi:hypothetical protein